MTSSYGQYPGSPDVATIYAAQAAEKVSRLQGLSTFFSEALPLILDVDALNSRLGECGRPDLVLTDPAPMLEVTQQTEVFGRGCNFAPSFAFWTGDRETGKEEWGQPVTEPIPATDKEIVALRDLPKFSSVDEITEIVNTGAFTALGRTNHSTKPAFLRMLILFPDFTASLTSKMSAPENRYSEWQFVDELYIAYQLMSHLVDKSDPYVVDEQGQINEWYVMG